MAPSPGRHRWSPPDLPGSAEDGARSERPRITWTLRLIVAAIVLLVIGGMGVAALLDPEPRRSGLGVTDGYATPGTGEPTSSQPTDSTSSATSPSGAPVTATGAAGPRTVNRPDADRRYDNCTQVVEAGLGPYRAGRDSEYAWYPDGDRDGWACERAPDRVHYRNCTEVYAAGAAPLYQGEPGYGRHLDRDGDGVACD